MRARDDLAEMLCKRVSSIVKRAKTELEEIRLRQRAVSEKLIGTYRTVLESLDPEAEEPGGGAARAVAAVEEAGGFAAQLADIEEVSAYHWIPASARSSRHTCWPSGLRRAAAGCSSWPRGRIGASR
jgi:hypothetical protein